MENMSETNAERRRTRTLLLSAGAVLLVAGGITGSLFYRMRQAEQSQYGHEPGLPIPVRPEVAKAQRKARLAKVQLLRDKWRPWALRHKAELKRMRAGDQAAMLAVWNAVPGQPSSKLTGFSAQELEMGIAPASWQPTAKIAQAPPGDLKGQRRVEETRQAGQKGLRYYFNREHDIMLSWLSHPGEDPSVHFWASGRITEQTADVKRDASGKALSAEAVQHEIAPPYEFVR